jgi:hypothetical protein
VTDRALLSGAVRLGLQEQGRAAAARRRRRLPAVAARSWRRSRASTIKTGETATSPQADVERAALACSRSRSWTTRSSARSPSAASTRASSRAAWRRQLDARQERARRPHAAHARQQPRGHQGGLTPATSSRCIGLKDTSARARRCATRTTGDPREDGVPRAGHQIAIEPKSKADQEKLGVALQKLADEDPSFRVNDRPGERPDHPQGHGRAASRHQGRHPEAHLQGRRQHRRAAGCVPRDARRAAEHRLHAQEADRWYGSVRPRQARLEPNETGKGNEFESKIVGGSVPKEYIPGVEKGLESIGAGTAACSSASRSSTSRSRCIDGAFHEVDSSAIAFEIATRSRPCAKAVRRRVKSSSRSWTSRW